METVGTLFQKYPWTFNSVSKLCFVSSSEKDNQIIPNTHKLLKVHEYFWNVVLKVFFNFSEKIPKVFWSF